MEYPPASSASFTWNTTTSPVDRAIHDVHSLAAGLGSLLRHLENREGRLAGGGIGIMVGIGFAAAIGKISPLPADVELWSVLTGLGVASGVGLVFGIFPAMKAARLDPIESLRYE